MSTRTARCSCGQLSVQCSGEPIAVGLCHCRECQRRSGNVFSVQARFLNEQLKVEGTSSVYERSGDTGKNCRFQFCPNCGSTVLWTAEGLENHTIVAVGAFADESFPKPNYSVYEARQHPWVTLSHELEHYD